MNTPNSRITYLWQQFSTRKATRAELDELIDLLSSGSHDEESRQYLQTLLKATPAGDDDPERWQPILQSILHPVKTLDLPSAPASGPSRIRRLVRISMTAAAVFFLFIGFFRLWRTSHSDRALSVASLVQVSPGGNKAVLTLAGGQKIVLDSAGTGMVAIQGNTNVQKLGDGKLAYEGGEKAGAGERAGSTQLFNTLTTPRGGQYQLTLPDGTKVWLNAASSLTYPTSFTGPDRSVEMTGEVYFEVVHDKKRPFKVKIGSQLIEDIGTHFNVNGYIDEPSQVTTLLEGTIKVGEYMLKPGEKASVAASGMVRVSKGDPEQAIAWKNGLFDFSDANLQLVMRQLARWYNVDITYEGNIPERQFNGMIGRSLTLNQVLKGLSREGIHYRIEGNHLIITP